MHAVNVYSNYPVGVSDLCALHGVSDINVGFPTCSTQLGSGIGSTALQCGTRLCPTDRIELEKPVIITIKHSEEVQVSGLEICM